MHQIDSTIIVKEERRIDPAYIGQPTWIRLGSGRIGRRYAIIATTENTRVDDIEYSIVVLDRCRENAPRQSKPIEVEHIRSVDDVSYLSPINQIPAVKDGYPWIEPECRVDQIVVSADTSDAWVRIESGDNRVSIFVRIRRYLENRILTW